MPKFTKGESKLFKNKQENDVLKVLFSEPYINQRILAQSSGHSLGVVNRSVRRLMENGYLDGQLKPTLKARQEYQDKEPRNAVILAAGFGMRMVPIFREYLQTGLVPRFPTLIVCGFMVLAGIQSFFAGMILEVMAAKDKRDFEYRLAKINAEKRGKAGEV